MLLSVHNELGDDIVTGTRQNAVLYTKVAAADGSDHAARYKEKLFRGRNFIEHLRDGDHDLFRDEGSLRTEPKLRTSVFREACPVDCRDVGGFAHCSALKVIDEAELHHNFAIRK